MSSDQYGPGYGQGGRGYGPPPGGQGGQSGQSGQGGQGGPGYGPPSGPSGYGPGPSGPGYGSGPSAPGYGPGPGGPGYGPGPGRPGPGGLSTPGAPGYGPGPNPYAAPAPQGAGGYPVKVRFQYPEKLSRGLIFVKWLLVIPHLIVLYILFVCMGVVSFIAWFAILFTGRYPRGMWDFTTGVIRWQIRVVSYMYLQHDAYPPFSLQDE